MSVAEREGSEFTEYADFKIEYRDASHRYWIVADEQRRPAISVTSALKILDKPALIGWAERMGVEGALRLERAGQLVATPIEEAVHKVRISKEGADAKRDAGADRGTAIHEALRIYCSEGDVPKLADFPHEVRGYVQGLCRWLLAAKPEPIHVEQVVGSRKHEFAGRFDLLAMIDGKRTLVDLKTSARVWPEHHLQVAAYMHALGECGGAADRSVIVAVGEDGTFDALEGIASAGDYLSVLYCHRAVTRLRSAVRAAERIVEEVTA